jgi:tetratricopeptide (TPR) repeat protein
MLFAIWAVGVVAAWWNRDRYVSFAIIWFLVTLAPVLNVAGVGVPAYGERYLYIPSVGICWLGGQALWPRAGPKTRAGATAAEDNLLPGGGLPLLAGASRQITAVIMGSAVVFAASVRTLVRLPVWRNNFTLGLATVRENPNAATFYIYLGNAYRREGKQNLARINYVLSIAGDVHAAEGFVNLAAVILDDGNMSGAEEILRRGSQLNPTYSKLPFALGLVALHRGSRDEAADLFSRALSLDPNDYEALFQLGLASLQEGHFEQAESLLARDAIVQPASVPVHLNLGAALSRQKKFGAAEVEFRRAIQLAPDNEAPYLALAGVYEDEGKRAEALEFYQRIVSAAPGSGNGQFRLGVLALKMGKTDEAVTALEKAVAVQPKSTMAHAQLGLAYLESGRRGDARREIEEARTLDPKDETVQMALKKLAKDR